MRSALLFCLLIGFAGCGPKIDQPVGAKLNVYAEWPPDTGAAPVEIELTQAEWKPVQPLLPDLSKGERKLWKNSVPRLHLVLLGRDGETIADGYFDESASLRMTFQDHKTAFYDVSPKLKERLVGIAEERGHWK